MGQKAMRGYGNASELHDVLAEAARADGISIVDYVKRLLQASA